MVPQKREDGTLLSFHPQWSDIIELDLEKNSQTGLWDELIEILIYWVQKGVDGFRCDVASIIPLDFWNRAKTEIERLNPAVIWLAENWTFKGMEKRKRQNLYVSTSIEQHSVFQMTYDYDSFGLFQKLLKGETDLETYLGFLGYMDLLYPRQAIKLRFVDNHDTKRLISIIKNENITLAWIGFTGFNRGSFLIYAGLETKTHKAPSKFDLDKLEWDNYDWQPFLKELVLIKKKIIGHFTIITARPAITAIYYDTKTGDGLFGIFNVNNLQKDFFDCCLPDGVYYSEITQTDVTIIKGRSRIPQAFDIISFKAITGLKITPLGSIFF